MFDASVLGGAGSTLSEDHEPHHWQRSKAKSSHKSR